MNIFIVGMRRSGTTIFWKTFRQDKRFVCYDEPFNSLLYELPAENEKGTRTEFIKLYKGDAVKFRSLFSPISVEEELQSGLTLRQQAYLKWLLQTGENVVCDFVRCNFKIQALYEVDPSAFLIHLYRSPAAVVSSHLLPSGGEERWQRRIANILRKKTFWTRKSWYNSWHFEDIIDRVSRAHFEKYLLEMGLNPKVVTSLPAVGKLLAFWKVNFETVERDGKRYFRDRFLSISFENFCSNSQKIMESIYKILGFPMPTFDFTAIHPAKPAFRRDSSEWGKYFELLNLPNQ